MVSVHSAVEHGLMLLIDNPTARGYSLEVQCCSCKEKTTVSFELDGAFRLKAIKSSCSCRFEKCKRCTDKIVRMNRGSRGSQSAQKYLCLCYGERHFYSTDRDEEQPAVPNKRARTDGHGQSTTTEAQQLLDSVRHGLYNAVRIVAEDAVTRRVMTSALKASENPCVSDAHHDDTGVEAVQVNGTDGSARAADTAGNLLDLWGLQPFESAFGPDDFARQPWESGFGNAATPDNLARHSLESGFGHLANAATPDDFARLQALRDSDEHVEVLVAGKQSADHFQITFDTDLVKEGWLLMVTGIHHIAFAAAGDLDRSASDVFSVEDAGGVQRVLVSNKQGPVREDERMVLPSGDNDGTVLFKTKQRVVDEGLEHLVVGVRMGAVSESSRGRLFASCYTRAGFCDMGLVTKSIATRDAAAKVVNEDWRNATMKRLACLDEEIEGTKKRCFDLKAQLVREKERTKDGSELESTPNGDSNSLSGRKRELKEEEERLEKIEKARDKEELLRVLQLSQKQLQRELLVEKKTSQELRTALQREEVLLAVSRAEVATQGQVKTQLSEAMAKNVTLGCQVRELEKKLEEAIAEKKAVFEKAEAARQEAAVAIEDLEERSRKLEKVTISLLKTLQPGEKENMKALDEDRTYTLRLNHRKIGVEGTRLLAAALPLCRTLSGVAFKDIDNSCVGSLLVALPKCSRLVRVKLTDSTSAMATVKSVLDCPVLEHLIIESVHIGADGAKLLATVLSCRGRMLKLSCYAIAKLAMAQAHLLGRSSTPHS